MSRRKPTHGAHLDARVRFTCPSGHTLPGTVRKLVLGVGRTEYLYDDAHMAQHTAPDGRVSLRMACPTCRAEGRQTDLRVSWQRVRDALDERLPDLAEDDGLVQVDGTARPTITMPLA